MGMQNKKIYSSFLIKAVYMYKGIYSLGQMPNGPIPSVFGVWWKFVLILLCCRVDQLWITAQEICIDVESSVFYMHSTSFHPFHCTGWTRSQETQWARCMHILFMNGVAFTQPSSDSSTFWMLLCYTVLPFQQTAAWGLSLATALWKSGKQRTM